MVEVSASPSAIMSVHAVLVAAEKKTLRFIPEEAAVWWWAIRFVYSEVVKWSRMNLLEKQTNKKLLHKQKALKLV